MRRTLLLLSLCGCAQPAAPAPIVPIAASPAPQAASAPLPSAIGELAGEWRLAFRLTQESACSQSFDVTTRSGQYVLVIGPNAEVHLDVEAQDTSSFGPSVGRYMAGDRDFGHRDDRVRLRWSGTASLQRAELRLDLKPDPDNCKAARPIDPQPCPGAAVRLVCSRGQMQAQGMEIAGKASQETLQVLHCPWLGLRYPVQIEALKRAPLARAPGLTVESWTSSFDDRLVIKKTVPEGR